ncbi:cold-shock protein [Sansalvadorimonas verongulae]|uniref:cold-shock protein n=1 Tax=Sansalvadorimonas verongulae TaxID=2172824 RepID=UPI002E3756D9|nr:cold shock domain-containing protein [Sansalvadorimonas verongulae]
MFLTTLKYLQLLSGLLLTGLFLASPVLLPALYPAAFPVVATADFYIGEPMLLLMFATAATNLMCGSYLKPFSGGRGTLQTLGSLTLFIAGILAAACAIGRLPVSPVTAILPQITIGLAAVGTLFHGLCNLHLLNPSAASKDNIALESGRETGTVKWFNVSKGFGFITRDSGDDIFVHYRAIRGEGHRILSEGQRVDFVVAEKEKGLQAEDVAQTR